MEHRYQRLIDHAYNSFNARDIDEVFSTMDPEVNWSNGWEGGYVKGYDAVRDYWTRQWKELNPTVIPVSLKEKPGGQLEVTVHQVVKDMKGQVLFDGDVKHVYTIENDLITRMEIEKS